MGERIALQELYRAKLPRFGQAWTNEFLETHIKSFNDAAKTNGGVNAAARSMQLFGRAAMLISVENEIANVVNAPPGAKIATAQQGAGRLSGGYAGAVLFGEMASETANPWIVLGASVIGGITGSIVGEDAVKAMQSDSGNSVIKYDPNRDPFEGVTSF